MELQLCKKRTAYSAEPVPITGPMDLFYSNTWLGFYLDDNIKHAALYTLEEDIPPDFFRAPFAVEGNRNDLRRILFVAFEHSVYVVYRRLLMLVQYSNVAETTSFEAVTNFAVTMFHYYLLNERKCDYFYYRLIS